MKNVISTHCGVEETTHQKYLSGYHGRCSSSKRNSSKSSSSKSSSSSKQRQQQRQQQQSSSSLARRIRRRCLRCGASLILDNNGGCAALHDGVCGSVLDAALTVRSDAALDANVAFLTPVGTPRVLDLPVIDAVLCAIADNKNSMIKFRSTLLGED